jgi:hypothetical protein
MLRSGRRLRTNAGWANAASVPTLISAAEDA